LLLGTDVQANIVEIDRLKADLAAREEVAFRAGYREAGPRVYPSLFDVTAARNMGWWGRWTA